MIWYAFYDLRSGNGVGPNSYSPGVHTELVQHCTLYGNATHIANTF